MKTLLLVLLLLLAISGCVDKDAYLNKVRPIAAEVDEVAKYETSNIEITFRDYLPKLGSAAERTETMVRMVRSEESPFNETKTDSLLNYLSCCSQFITELKMLKEAQVEATYHIELSKAYNTESPGLRPAQDAFRHRLGRLQETCERLIKLTEYLEVFVPKNCLADTKVFVETAKVSF